LSFFGQGSLDLDLSIYASHLAGIEDMYHHAQLFC
jgi:hypothetical protein